MAFSRLLYAIETVRFAIQHYIKPIKLLASVGCSNVCSHYLSYSTHYHSIVQSASYHI